MYTEALKQIREARPRPGGAVTSGPAAAPPKRRRKRTPEERQAFYEQQGWLPEAAPEVASIDGATLANSATNGDEISQGE